MVMECKSCNTLRWIGTIPGAFVGALIAYTLVVILMTFSIRTGFGTGFSGSRIGYGDVFLREFLGYGAAGAVYIYAGVRIAPSHRIIVTYILTAITVLLACYLTYPSIVINNWAHVFSVLSLPTGAGLVAYKVIIGDFDFDHGTL
jgi:hypothetical protein